MTPRKLNVYTQANITGSQDRVWRRILGQGKHLELPVVWLQCIKKFTMSAFQPLHPCKNCLYLNVQKAWASLRKTQGKKWEKSTEIFIPVSIHLNTGHKWISSETWGLYKITPKVVSMLKLYGNGKRQAIKRRKGPFTS